MLDEPIMTSDPADASRSWNGVYRCLRPIDDAAARIVARSTTGRT